MFSDELAPILARIAPGFRETGNPDYASKQQQANQQSGMHQYPREHGFFERWTVRPLSITPGSFSLKAGFSSLPL
jgi:hypothetical protein